jgi:hypothetical protein
MGEKAHLPARAGKRLASRADGDGAVAHARQRREVHVRRSVNALLATQDAIVDLQRHTRGCGDAQMTSLMHRTRHCH